MRVRKSIFKIIRLFNKSRAAKFLGVKVGKDCRLIIEDYGTEPWLIEIGNNVTITSGVKLLTHDGSTCLAKDEKGRRYKYGRITIGDNVFIGVNAIVLPGITIGNNVIIGAGSVVTRSVASDSVVTGNPARHIKSFTDTINYHLLYSISDQDWNKKCTFRENVEIFQNLK